MFRELGRKVTKWRTDFINYTHPMAEMNQNYHGLLLANEIFEMFQRRGNSTGQLLYAVIPHALAPTLIKTGIDPYNKQFNEVELQAWIAEHIIFDADGGIIAIRDGFDVLAYTPGFEEAINTYAKMRGLY